MAGPGKAPEPKVRPKKATVYIDPELHRDAKVLIANMPEASFQSVMIKLLTNWVRKRKS